MSEDRPPLLRALVFLARISVMAGIFVGISGAARVVADGLETGTWDPLGAVVWIALGLLPIGGGWITGRLLRGPGNVGLAPTAAVAVVLGVGVAAIWIMDGLSRRGG